MGDAHRVSNALTLKLFHDAVYYQHCNAPLVPISANIQRKQPGPKPKPLHERKTLSFKPVTRVERSYKHQKRVEVLLFLLNYRLTGTPGRGGPHRQGLPDSQDGFHPPTFFEASQFFKIPEATIKSWWKKRDQLVHKEDQRRDQSKWPELEDVLYACFLTRRAENRVVSVGWFRRESRKLFRDTYPESHHFGYFLLAGSEASYVGIGFHTEGLLRKPQSFLQSTLRL